VSGSSIHASAVLVGAKAALIQGASGSGKSSLAAALLSAGESGQLRFARLIADDRVLLEVRSGRLLARAVPLLAGLLEIRGAGIQTVAYEPVGQVALVVSLGDPAAQRAPVKNEIEIDGIKLPFLPLPQGLSSLQPLLAALNRLPFSPGFDRG
jgi:serine kinase of HPr protein (carbohydrate metabolism regulator)